MNAFAMIRSLTPAQRNTFLASFLGWTLDAFDYFVVTLVVVHIAHDFQQTITVVTLAITITLAMRWLGALIFGFLADRFGRRLPLMLDILFYSVIELLTAFSPNFTVFFILRALFGIGMGGEWGVGAALTMEVLPAQARGFFSGLLQQGYACGYLLAALAFFLVYPHFGWRALFIIGVLPALLVVFIRRNVQESPEWTQQRAARTAPNTFHGHRWTAFPLFFSSGGARREFGRVTLLAIYVILLMAAFNFMSHGTQDLYPTFLETQHHLLPGDVTIIAVIYNIGAIIGGTLFGLFSQRIGRRVAIIIAAFLGILVIPLWALSSSLVLLTVGAFLMQFFVQGAWGVIPAHLNEMSPSRARGTFPGFTYQIGNVISAPAATLEAAFAATHFKVGTTPDYGRAQAVLAVIVFVAVIVFTALGWVLGIKDRRSQDFATIDKAA